MRITHETMARDLMRDLGRRVEAMNRIENSRESISGVNIDEEMARWSSISMDITHQRV